MWDSTWFLSSFGSSLHWFHLSIYLMTCLATICLVRRKSLITFAAGFAANYDPRKISVRADVIVGLINLIFVLPFISHVSSGLIRKFEQFTYSIVHLSRDVDDSSSGLLWTILLTGINVIAFDFGNYFGHWLVHRLRILERFHAVHHEIETMNVLAAFRRHPIDGLVRSVIASAIVSIAMLMASAVIPAVDISTLFGVNIVLFAFTATVNFQHSHIAIHYPRPLRAIFLSPHLHLIHHSADPRHFGKNLGLIFSIWDQIFGTYLDEPVDESRMVYGSGQNGRLAHSALRALLYPFTFNLAIKQLPEKNQRDNAKSRDDQEVGADA